MNELTPMVRDICKYAALTWLWLNSASTLFFINAAIVSNLQV